MKSKTLIAVVCLLLLLGGAGVLLLARRHTFSAAAGSTGSGSQQTGSTQTAPTQWTATVPLLFDSLNDFPVKGLPPSAPVPLGSPDQVAKVLARKISRGGEDSFPSLLTALQSSGFTIMDWKHTVLRTPLNGGKGNGLVIFDWEAAGMLKLTLGGVGTALDKVTTLVTQKMKKSTASKLSDLMLQDLRLHADDNGDPYGRFWARFIIELSKYAAKPVDLMTAASSDVTLNMIQESLWMRRFTGVIYALRKDHPKKHSNVDQNHNFHGTLVNAGFRNGAELPLRLASLSQEGGDLPCQLTEDESLDIDARSYLMGIIRDFDTTVMAKALEEMEMEGEAEAMESMAHGLALANGVLVVAKLAAALEMMEGEIVMAGNGPLIRTFNSVQGQQRLMTATLRTVVGQKQLLNCMRTQLVIFGGVDFALPTDGPVAEKSVEWHFAGQNEIRVNNAATRNLDHFVSFKAAPDAENQNSEELNDNPQNQVTDKEGKSRMYLVGLPKVPYVDQSTCMNVPKQADIVLGVTLKAAKDVHQNLIDIIGIAGGTAVNGPGMLLLIPGELAYRAPWAVAHASFPVTDHEKCDGQVVGTLNYLVVQTITSNRGIQPTKNEFSTTEGGHENQSNTLTLSGTISMVGKDSIENSTADSAVLYDKVVNGKLLCSRIKGLEPSTTNESYSMFASGSTSGPGSVSVSLGPDQYRINWHPNSVQTTYTRDWQTSTQSCAHPKPDSNSTSGPTELGMNDPVSIKRDYGADRKTLSGSYSGSDTHGVGETTVTVTVMVNWNFHICSK